MIMKRVSVLLATGALAASGTAVAAHAALASDDGNQPAASAPAATPQTITRTVPGVGTVTFTVDPTTGAITNVVVTPVTGVTAGTPVVNDGKILIPVTLANGTTATVRVKVEAEEGQVRVEAEVENEAENEVDNEAEPAPPTTEPAQHEEAPAAEQHQAPEAEHGDGEVPSVTVPPAPHHDDGSPGPSGSEDRGGQSGGSDGGHGGSD